MELLEREDFLALLDEYRRDAVGGDSRVVLIAGEAGVGKTTLVEEFQSRTTDTRWLWGACDGSLTPQPRAPLLDIADQLVDLRFDLVGLYLERSDGLGVEVVLQEEDVIL